MLIERGLAWGNDVLRIDHTPLYQLGGALHVLKEVVNRDEAGAFDQAVALYNAIGRLEELSSGVPFAVSYSRESLMKLLDEAKRLVKHFEGDNALFDMDKGALQSWQMSALKSDLDVFEHQFMGEVKDNSTYIVPDRGIFNTKGLVDYADNHIHATIRSSVSAFARSEIRSAGRCLAFGLFSASGFHSARAVESVLKDYYARFLTADDDLSMGLMAGRLNDLIKSPDQSKSKPQENTVRHLRDITTFDRNPLIHKGVDLTLPPNGTRL